MSSAQASRSVVGTAGACDDCLKRGYLLGALAEPLSRRVGSRAATAAILSLGNADLIAVAGRPPEARTIATRFDAPGARAALARAGVWTVCRHDRLYPPGLRDLSDPPAALFVVGRDELVMDLAHGAPAVAIVGARTASPYGLEVAHGLGRDLGAAGVPVVSGMALGVDAAAHRGVLDAGGQALAVLAGGPDVTYPKRHHRLHEQLRSRGAVVSELPPGALARRWAFPARNRIMAGLARMTILVEAAKASGSMITAERALGLGREVGAVPGRVTARVAGGTNQLLRDGACVVRDAGDVLDELYGPGLGPDGKRRATTAPDARVRLEPRSREVLDGVEAGLDPDAICARTGRSAAEVRTTLAELELRGFLKRDLLGSYERVAR